MMLEATDKPIRYCWPGGEVRLEPGKPVELPESRAQRLLDKVPGKVRVVPIYSVGTPVNVTSMNGHRWAGVIESHCVIPPGDPAKAGYWYAVVGMNRCSWVHGSLIHGRPPDG
jgi:hypothetical protein